MNVVHDQYLSPTWSPDGKDLIFVSNRGHIWGSGGFWRMPARTGAEPHEPYHEETTWKARPDWSRDSKRVVYSSYLGRQWHPLWLMAADGGDPLQLTYREGDERTSIRTEVRIAISRSGWYLLRARGNGPLYPILVAYPYAEYFLEWIGRLEHAALKYKDWDTEEERASMLATIRRARADFEARKHP